MILILLLIAAAYFIVQQLIYLEILPPQLYDKSWKLDLALGLMAAGMFYVLWVVLKKLGVIKGRKI